MPDLKVSSLNPATSLGSSDLLMLLQNGNSLKIDITTFLQKLPVSTKVLEATETLTVPSVMSATVLVSKIYAKTAGVIYTLAAGSHGTEKIIVCSQADSTTPTATLNVASGAGVSTVTFNALGDSVRLKNVDGLWYVIGSNSVTVS
jgi:hypothetical protein